MKTFLTNISKTAGILLAIVVLIAPRPAYAIGEIVFDPAAFVKHIITSAATYQTLWKEMGLDPLATGIAGGVTQILEERGINAFLTGVDGAPAFITDLQEHLGTVEDTAVAGILAQLRNAGSIQSPFSAEAIEEAERAYYQSTGSGVFERTGYTLDETCENDEAFAQGDFSACGFSGLRSALTNIFRNTPTGLSISATDEVLRGAASASETRLQELNWGNGTLARRESCGDNPALNTDGNISLSQIDETLNCAIQMPGAQISEAYNRIRALGSERLVAADEWSEVLFGLAFGLGDLLEGDGDSSGDSGSESTTSGDSGTGSADENTDSIAGNFISVIDGQQRQVNEYRTSWERIRAVAQEALASCQSGGNTVDKEEAQNTLNTATVALGRAASAIAELNALKVQAQDATSFIEVQAFMEEYNALQNPPAGAARTLPSFEDMLYAAEQSQDSQTSTGEDSLYMKMKNIADNNCSVFGS